MADYTQLVSDFWIEVFAHLVGFHRLNAQEARTALSDYRAALQRHQAEDMIYHQDNEQVAKVIFAGRDSHFLDPISRPELAAI